MRIMTVPTEWGAAKGGLNAFNYRLCIGLRASGCEVKCLVKIVSTEDLANAGKNGVQLIHGGSKLSTKWTIEDRGYIENKMFDGVDAVVVHDIVSSAVIPRIKECKHALTIVAFIHTWYRDSDYFSDETPAEVERKIRAQLELVAAADIVFTSGSWIAAQLLKEIRNDTDREKVKVFVPGRVDASVQGGQARGSILTIGRLSLGKKDKKGAAQVFEAYKLMADDFRKDGQRSWSLPELRALGVDGKLEDIQKIKAKVFGVSNLAYVVPLPYEKHYEFDGSSVEQELRRAKIVVTPSFVEAFGLTSLEAASLGIPLIATERSGFYMDLQKQLPTQPHRSINWLKASDFEFDGSEFKRLAMALKYKLDVMLDDYETYRDGALQLAREIQSHWPSWADSSAALVEDVKKHLNRNSPESLFPPPEPANPFAALAQLKWVGGLASSNADGPSHGAQTASADTRGTEREPLETLVREAFGENFSLVQGLEDALVEQVRGKRCTVLQQQLLDRLRGNLPEDYQDILLAGGTSSGKTTAAEILFGIANNRDIAKARVLYLAPTRALAQERFREWVKLYGPIRGNDNIILSTGEDHEHDRALARGDFFIACLVFEKANVLLSASEELMAHLNLVVVDELHMIEDVHRGPIIETLIAKIKYQKSWRSDRTDARKRPLRIVAITTDVGSAKTFSEYLSEIDEVREVRKEPWVFTDIGRPADVEHMLVLPQNSTDDTFTLLPIARFEKNSPLSLSEDAVRGIRKRLAQLMAPSANNGLRRDAGRDDGEMLLRRYFDFLAKWLSEYPYGRRLLVFVASKAQQQQLADRLQKRARDGIHGLNHREKNASLDKLVRELEADDTSPNRELLERVTRQGIFIHNADVSRKFRVALEVYLRQSLAAGFASEIILATETLSYGVNLSIDDVAMLSVVFPDSERDRYIGVDKKPLTHCEFMNMVGRAGRLQQKASDATFYLWPINNDEQSAAGVIDDYYSTASPLKSQLMHGFDYRAYKNILRYDSAAKAPLEFTYPLVRAVLDGLRFVGGAPGDYGVRRNSSATLDAIQQHFIERLLFFRQMENPTTDTARIRACAQLILDGAEGEQFELVKASAGAYKITPLGSSIIDTGTEISTMAPLKLALERLHVRWKLASLPVEALLLPIVIQDEAHRQVLLQMPELRPGMAMDGNREAMLDWLASEYQTLGFTVEAKTYIAAFLDDCDADPHHAPQVDISSKLVHDACLRLFCGLLMWVSGRSISDVHAGLKVVGKLARYTEIQLNVATFAERISWKLAFLVDLMRFGSHTSRLLDLQTRARRLINRLRIGCAENALPFLARDGNRESMISRSLAHRLLREGATIRSISAGTFDFTGGHHENETANKVKSQIDGYIASSFHKLKAEFIYGSPEGGGLGQICRSYWEYADDTIASMTKDNRTPPTWLNLPAMSESVPALTGPSAAATGARVAFQYRDGSLTIVGERETFEGDDKKLVPAVKLFVRPVRVRRGETEIRAPDGYTPVLVDFPWLIAAHEPVADVVRLSPASFGIVISLISRRLFKDSILVLETLKRAGKPISTAVLVQNLSEEIVMEQMPEPLYAAWSGYWDAE